MKRSVGLTGAKKSKKHNLLRVCFSFDHYYKPEHTHPNRQPLDHNFLLFNLWNYIFNEGGGDFFV